MDHSLSLMVASLKTFGKRVRELRNKVGLSQEELAEVAGLHRTYIGGIERGERNVAILNVFEIARALRVRPADLFSGLS